jgi:hypothetical protein
MTTHKKSRPVDMSLPPELRGRKRNRSKTGKGSVAQLDHASNGKSRKKAREGEKRMRQEREAG